jgi:hypothetical protein
VAGAELGANNFSVAISIGEVGKQWWHRAQEGLFFLSLGSCMGSSSNQKDPGLCLLDWLGMFFSKHCSP